MKITDKKVQQLISMLLEGIKPRFICHKLGISRATLYKYKKKFPLFFWR